MIPKQARFPISRLHHTAIIPKVRSYASIALSRTTGAFRKPALPGISGDPDILSILLCDSWHEHHSACAVLIGAVRGGLKEPHNP